MTKYFVKRTSDITWEVEEEDGEPYYVRYDVFKEQFICDCKFNSLVEKPCKHILYVKQNLVFGLEIFDDNYIEE